VVDPIALGSLVMKSLHWKALRAVATWAAAILALQMAYDLGRHRGASEMKDVIMNAIRQIAQPTEMV